MAGLSLVKFLSNDRVWTLLMPWFTVVISGAVSHQMLLPSRVWSIKSQQNTHFIMNHNQILNAEFQQEALQEHKPSKSLVWWVERVYPSVKTFNQGHSKINNIGYRWWFWPIQNHEETICSSYPLGFCLTDTPLCLDPCCKLLLLRVTEVWPVCAQTREGEIDQEISSQIILTFDLDLKTRVQISTLSLTNCFFYHIRHMLKFSWNCSMFHR